MSALEPAHIQKALNMAFSRIVSELERTREPWIRSQAIAPHGIVNGRGQFDLPNGFGTDPRKLLQELRRRPARGR